MKIVLRIFIFITLDIIFTKMGCGESKIDTKENANNPPQIKPIQNAVPSQQVQSNQPKQTNYPPKQEVQAKPQVNESTVPGTIVQSFSGTIFDHSEFQDCLITNEAELDSKLRKFIVTQVVNYVQREGHMGKPDVKFVPNTSDEILNKKANIDFNLCDVIVAQGSKISAVKVNKNNVYEVKPSAEIVAGNQYFAVVVKSPPGQKPVKMVMMGAKPMPYVEQRALNMDFEQLQNQVPPEF